MGLKERLESAYINLQNLQIQPTLNNITILQEVMNVLKDVYPVVGGEQESENEKQIEVEEIHG